MGNSINSTLNKSFTDYFKDPDVYVIDQNTLVNILYERIPVPDSETLIFTKCHATTNPEKYVGAQRLVFPKATKVIFYNSDIYFAYKWIYRPIFPNATEIWVDKVPKKSFTNDFPKYYTLDDNKNKIHFPENTEYISKDSFYVFVRSLTKT